MRTIIALALLAVVVTGCRSRRCCCPVIGVCRPAPPVSHWVDDSASPASHVESVRPARTVAVRTSAFEATPPPDPFTQSPDGEAMTSATDDSESFGPLPERTAGQSPPPPPKDLPLR